jgi:hypothetical protein
MGGIFLAAMFALDASVWSGDAFQTNDPPSPSSATTEVRVDFASDIVASTQGISEIPILSPNYVLTFAANAIGYLRDGFLNADRSTLYETVNCFFFRTHHKSALCPDKLRSIDMRLTVDLSHFRGLPIGDLFDRVISCCVPFADPDTSREELTAIKSSLEKIITEGKLPSAFGTSEWFDYVRSEKARLAAAEEGARHIDALYAQGSDSTEDAINPNE